MAPPNTRSGSPSPETPEAPSSTKPDVNKPLPPKPLPAIPSDQSTSNSQTDSPASPNTTSTTMDGSNDNVTSNTASESLPSLQVPRAMRSKLSNFTSILPQLRANLDTAIADWELHLTNLQTQETYTTILNRTVPAPKPTPETSTPTPDPIKTKSETKKLCLLYLLQTLPKRITAVAPDWPQTNLPTATDLSPETPLSETNAQLLRGLLALSPETSATPVDDNYFNAFVNNPGNANVTAIVAIEELLATEEWAKMERLRGMLGLWEVLETARGEGELTVEGVWVLWREMDEEGCGVEA